MNDQLFDLLVAIGILTVNDLEALAKIRAYIAKLQQEIADAKAATAVALEQVAASAEVVRAAQAEAAQAQTRADEALAAQKAAEDAFAADQINDAALSAGLAEIVATIPVDVVPPTE